MAESPNPMHRLWSERRWLKLALAHGCYWHRCTFCDTCLDTIGRFDPADAKTIVDWMESAMAQTGRAQLPLRRRGGASSRCSRRWPAAFSTAASKSSGGPTSASSDTSRPRSPTCWRARVAWRSPAGWNARTDRLLALQRKGFDLTQATRVMAAFARAGVLVHAYLMYGYPTQTAQETVDALELVRQLFAAGFLDSAYWHRFALTVHSPAFREADQLGIRILDRAAARPLPAMKSRFPSRAARIPRLSPLACAARSTTSCTAQGLRADVRSWFDFPVPRPKLARGFVRAASHPAAAIEPPLILCRVSMLVWNGSSPNTTP